MLQLFQEYTEQIRAEALECYPEEGVWVITDKGCRRVQNIDPDPENFFDVSVMDVQRAVSEGLKAIVHSHTNGNHYPSAKDMQVQINTAVPWGIVCCDGVVSTKIRWWGGSTPEQVEDLMGRTFCHGTADCYAAVRDHYLVELGITLPEFPREWEWWKNGQNLLREGFSKAGFSVVGFGDPKPGDVWLAAIQTDTLNHCGVLLDNGLTYHQPGSMHAVNDSKKVVVQPIYRYLPHIQLWVRHKDMQ